MNLFSNPRWIDKDLLQLTTLDEIPETKILEIRDRLKTVSSDKPLVSVIIAAWNEEVNIVQCLNSLS
ncbi:MAG TPA: glycosyltransferase, partial [Cyclobacteriaceae bacterium]